MARIRTIKPEFTQSETMGSVSRDARLLFILIWTICDDSGRTRAASRMLASLLYPFDDDVPSLIDGWLDELERAECITRYVIDGTTYLQVSKWLKHQKIDKPSASRIPPPRESSRILANPREASMVDLGSRTMDLGPRREERAYDQGDVDQRPEEEPISLSPFCENPKRNADPKSEAEKKKFRKKEKRELTDAERDERDAKTLIALGVPPVSARGDLHIWSAMVSEHGKEAVRDAIAKVKQDGETLWPRNVEAEIACQAQS